MNVRKACLAIALVAVTMSSNCAKREIYSKHPNLTTVAGVPMSQFRRVRGLLRSQGFTAEAGDSTVGGVPILVPESQKVDAQILIFNDARKNKYDLALIKDPQ